jgi:hypothetical protein
MMLYNKTYNLEKMLSDHTQPVRYEIPLPPHGAALATGVAHANRSVTKPAAEHLAKSANLYIHAPRGPATRHIDDSTEQCVDATRTGVAQ